MNYVGFVIGLFICNVFIYSNILYMKRIDVRPYMYTYADAKIITSSDLNKYSNELLDAINNDH